MPTEEAPKRESLRELLGGGREAIEATIPILVFVVAWVLSGNDVLWASGSAVVSAVAIMIIGLVVCMTIYM